MGDQGLALWNGYPTTCRCIKKLFFSSVERTLNRIIKVRRKKKDGGCGELMAVLWLQNFQSAIRREGHFIHGEAEAVHTPDLFPHIFTAYVITKVKTNRDNLRKDRGYKYVLEKDEVLLLHPPTDARSRARERERHGQRIIEMRSMHF